MKRTRHKICVSNDGVVGVKANELKSTSVQVCHVSSLCWIPMRRAVPANLG